MLATILSILFVIVTTAVLPILAMASGRAVERHAMQLPWRHVFLSTLLIQALLLALALLVAWAAGITLFPAPPVRWSDAASGALFLAAAFSAAAIKWRCTDAAQRRRLLRLLPGNRREHALNGALLALAAIGEEVVYRGVLFSILATMMGSWWAGAIGSALAFGAAHAVQGWASGAIVMVFGLGFQALVLATGDLYTAMAAHLVFDATVIAVYTRLGAPEAPAPARSPDQAQVSPSGSESRFSHPDGVTTTMSSTRTPP